MPLIYVSSSNGHYILGMDKTRALLTFPFNYSKSHCFGLPYGKLLPLVVTACNGLATTKTFGMNFLKYLTTPMKLLTYVTLVEVGHLLMASILVGSTFTSPPPITCPRYSKDSFLKLMLIEISNQLLFFKSVQYMF